MTRVQGRLPTTALAACILGFVLCPLPFLALAARAELQPTASIILATAFVLSAGFLLMRLLVKPTLEPSGGIIMRVFELASWTTVASILVFISQMHLMKGFERLGAVSLVFLSASALCFPLVWMRRSDLEQRLTRLPQAFVVSTLCTLLALSGAILFVYLTTPARFL